MTEATQGQPMAERLGLLHQCGRDTDMGRLLRLFWQPVGLSELLKAGSAKPVRILGEDLTLYRGESGKPYPGRRPLRRTA